MNLVLFVTTNFVYEMLHEHSIVLFLYLHFLRITKPRRIAKFKSRTSVRGWICCSDPGHSCSDQCKPTYVEVIHCSELIFALYQGSYKHSECGLYQSWIQRNTFSRINFDITMDVQRHKVHPNKTNSSSSNKNPLWDMILPRQHRKPQNWQQSTAV